MIGYVTLVTNDIQRAAKFYVALLGSIGATRMMESDSFIAWSTPAGGPALSVIFLASSSVERLWLNHDFSWAIPQLTPSVLVL